MGHRIVTKARHGALAALIFATGTTGAFASNADDMMAAAARESGTDSHLTLTVVAPNGARPVDVIEDVVGALREVVVAAPNTEADWGLVGRGNSDGPEGPAAQVTVRIPRTGEAAIIAAAKRRGGEERLRVEKRSQGGPAKTEEISVTVRSLPVETAVVAVAAPFDQWKLAAAAGAGMVVEALGIALALLAVRRRKTTAEATSLAAAPERARHEPTLPTAGTPPSTPAEAAAAPTDDGA